MNNLCSLIQLYSIFPTCVICAIFAALSTFVVLSNLNRIIKHLLPSHPLLSTHVYVIYASYKCTCTTHKPTQFSIRSYRALGANRSFQLNRRLWLLCHSDYSEIEAWLGVFSKNIVIHLIYTTDTYKTNNKIKNTD